MSEQVLPLPLSGGEIIKAVLHHVELALKRDCYLNDVAAYETVAGTISVRLKMKDCGRAVEVSVDVPVSQGPAPTDGDPDVYDANATVELETAPPNVVRQETDQPLPVLVEDATGKREVRRVQYARPERSRAARPEQTVARGAERARSAAQTMPPLSVPDLGEGVGPVDPVPVVPGAPTDTL